jgi:acetamidase/formamidase
VVGSAPYEIDAFAVMARPAETLPADGDGDGDGNGVATVDEDLAPQVLPWPLEVALAEAHDCLVVEGEDARVLRRALVGVGSTARYEQAGVRYDAWFRPLLPHEDGCAP